MKVTGLTINNFMAIGEVKNLPLDDRGLLLIQGVNEDDSSQESNGAGKSSIGDALCWCFYGETARQESGDLVINRTAGKNTEVVVEVEDDGDCYRISRYRKHVTHKNMLRLEMLDPVSSYWKDLTKGTDKLTQELVNKVLGCSYEVFAGAIYAGQEAMPDLPGMTDKQLKTLVEEAAGIDQLQSAYEVARRVMGERKAVVTDLSAKIMAKTSVIESYMETSKTTTTQHDDFEVKRKEAIKSTTEQLSKAESELDEERGPKILKMLEKLDQQANEARAKIAASDSERAKERELREQETQARNAVTRAEQAAKQAAQKAADLRHRFDHVDDQVGTACDSCGHVIEKDDLATNRAALKTQVVDAVTAAKQLKLDVEAAQKHAASALTALTDFTASMTDISAQAALLSEIETKRGTLNKAHDAWISQVEQIGELKGSIENFKARPNPHIETLKSLNTKIAVTQDERVELIKERDEAQVGLVVAEEAARVFGPAGVRAHILDNVTPYLNLRTSHYLSTLTDGNVTAVWSTITKTAKGELREKFSIEVQSATGGATFKSLSGGEKRKVRLACAMALQDMVASRATKPFKLFVADEIDHALDSAGLERLMDILEEKANDKGTVLVISHTDLKSWIPNCITVTKKGLRSTVDAPCLS